MSMLDAFLNKGFKASKCKTLLKLTIPRIKLLRNRRELQLKQMRRDIAKLLESGQEATARIRVEHIIREENMLAAQEIIELFCELISVRLPIIESQRECPLDLKEAISSICFAAPRCADLPELLQVQLAFVSKYGKEFVAAASELMPDCGVNRQLVELLSVRAPSAEKKLKLLKDIAEEHEIDWDPAPSETELFKSHEDLLNGPTQFVSGSKVPLPKENEEILQSTSTHAVYEHSESEEDFDELEFPEVPKMPLRPNAGPEMASPQPSAPHTEPYTSPTSVDPGNTFHAAEDESLKSSANPEIGKQFVPFIVPGLTQSAPPVEPPSMSSASVESTKPSTYLETSKQFVPFIAPAITKSSPSIDFPSVSPESRPLWENSESSQLSNPRRTRSDANVDLKDVLAAAKAAAESAERAAAAARAAASLTELRISELCKSKSDSDTENDVPGFDMSTDKPFHASNSDLSTDRGKLQVDDNPFGDDDTYDNPTENRSRYGTQGVTGLDTSTSADNFLKQESPTRQPERIPSMDDESVFTYPNLFSSQGSDRK
ncbi:uncharacterized protein LOC141605472 [Silene latifolia]|uniref:uncharacterized protein LOC141605472 n=1 Tax=Silene latifolia TaxID=37657 RepID=UPI003D77680A